ncbi:MAG TPA: response regulator transcription factor [Longimicrobiales bacterium]
MTDAVTVVMADDHPLFRRGLAEVLEADPSFRIVAEAADGETALALVRRYHPRIAILDINMPRTSGLEAAEILRQEEPDTAVVLLTMHREAGIFRRALDAGVKGYVLKDSAVIEIVACLHTVAAGRAYISPALSTELLDRRAVLGTPEFAALSDLTPAEQSVLRFIAAGLTSGEIADTLGNSVKTIENHRSHICQKLGLSGPQALLRFALEHKTLLAQASAIPSSSSTNPRPRGG